MGRPAKALTVVRSSVGSNPTLSAIVRGVSHTTGAPLYFLEKIRQKDA
jgi:hypothetical protein